MTPTTTKRLHPREHGRHSHTEDLAVLAAVKELRPYTAVANQGRLRWQQVAERVIAETGDDEISGDYCKRRYATLLDIASGVSDEEWSAEEELGVLKAALEEHNKWVVSTGGKAASLAATPAKALSRSSAEASPSRRDATPSTISTKPPLSSPADNPLRREGKPNARRQLLGRVAAACERGRKRMSGQKTTLSPRPTPSVVLSSLAAEMNENQPTEVESSRVSTSGPQDDMVEVPTLLGVDSSPTQTATESDNQKPTTAPADGEQEIGGAPPSVASPQLPLVAGTVPALDPETATPSRRSLFAGVIDWFKKPPEEPHQHDELRSQETAAPRELAQVREIKANAVDVEVETNEQTVASLSSKLSANEAELKQLKQCVVLLSAQLTRLEAAQGNEMDGREHDKKSTTMAQIQSHMGEKIADLTASFKAFKAETTKQLQQNRIHALKLHTQSQLELSQLRKTVASDRMDNMHALLQQIQRLEASTTTKGNEV